jgi:hypothetical protein
VKEVRNDNAVANTWPNVAGDHRGVLAWLLARLRVAGEGLGAATLWMAGFCPLYVVDAALRDFHEAVDPFSSLVLIGIGVSSIYIPFYLASSPERRFSMTTGLLIGSGLVAGLVGVWAST